MSHYAPFKSETKTFTPGAPVEFTDFVPPRGPGGGRVVVDRFVLCLNGTITVATAAFDGRDVCRLFQLINIEDKAGRGRWSLSGHKSRLASIMFNGIERHAEHANIAIGAAQTVDYRLILPMSKRFLRRPKDFAMPSDIFKKISVTFASYASAATSTTVLSAASLLCYVLAEWHEEGAVEFKAEDVIKSADFVSTTQGKISTSGAAQDIFLCREPAGAGTAGGDVITALTDARIEDLGVPLLTRQDLVHSYSVKRNVCPSALTVGAERYMEPVRAGVVLPVLVADRDTSLWDGKVTDSLKIDVGTGAAGLSAITREVVEKSQTNTNAQIGRFGIDPRTLRMKTEAKSRRSFADGWSKRQKLVAVWSAELPPQ